MYLLITFNNLLTTVIRRRNTSSVMQLLMITRTLFNNTSKKGKFINKINVQTFCCNDHYAIVYSIELKKRCQTFDTHQICIRYLWRRRKKKKRNIHNKREQNTFSKIQLPYGFYDLISSPTWRRLWITWLSRFKRSDKRAEMARIALFRMVARYVKLKLWQTAIMRLKNEWRFERSSSTKLERDNRRGVEEVTTRPREEWWSFLSSSFHPFSPPSYKKGTEWEGIAG